MIQRLRVKFITASMLSLALVLLVIPVSYTHLTLPTKLEV